ncbi:MAG: DNA-binding domain-containing protein [Thiotrichales bacterium]|nr:DNA-binding domain-containing protein [Thiotrichales bacterium]
MTALRELQRGFQSWVLGDASAPPVTVADTDAVSARERLKVYADAIRLRFLEVLGQDYPGLHTLAGDEEFRRLGLAYIEAHPSHHPSIRWFGAHLSAFLRSTAPWREQPVFAEMAVFEWAKGELLDAPDSPVVGVEDIAAIPPDRWAGIQPRLKPAVRRVTLEWNVPVVWKAIDGDETVPAPSRTNCAGSASRTECAVEWLLWRQDLLVRWRSIDPDEAWALRRCDTSEDFGAICAGLCERVGEEAAALRAATFLKQWAADGVLEAV